MRKRYDKEFKAKVALEALKGEKTMHELAITYSVHPNMITLWKRQILENAAALFERDGKNKATEEASRQKDELFKQIGQLKVENEYLKKKYKQLYGTEPKW
jgi:transposase-like protein